MFTCIKKNKSNHTCCLKLNHTDKCHFKTHIIIAGGRDFNNYVLARNSLYVITKDITDNQDIIILSGMAKGADQIGIDIALIHGTGLDKYPAEWDRYGKSAGYKRNELMARNADTLLAFWDSKSKGTKHMIDIANNLALSVHVINY